MKSTEVASSPSSTGETLHRLLHAYKSALRQSYRVGGIDRTLAEIRVLKGIARRNGTTARDVGQAMRQDKGRVARLIKQLITDGLITRYPHPHDSRARCLALTDAGRAFHERIVALEVDAGTRMAGDLSAETLAAFDAAAEAMIANLEQDESHAE